MEHIFKWVKKGVFEILAKNLQSICKGRFIVKQSYDQTHVI